MALRQLIDKGLQVFDSILKPSHMDVDELRAEGRYLEDVY